MGASYIINDRFDIGIETTVRNVWNDRLDAWESNGSANDKYSFTAIGVTYHLKKRKNVVKLENFEPNVLAAAEVDVDVEKKEELKEEIVEQKEDVAEEVEEVKEEVAEEIPAVEEKKDEKVNEQVAEKKQTTEPTETTPVVKQDEGDGYYVAVGAFRGSRANKFAEEVTEKGFEAVVIRNKRDTWNLVTVAKYDNLPDALRRMREVRAEGYPESWVHVKK